MRRITISLNYLVDNGMRVIGPVMITLAVTLISLVIYVILYQIIPFYIETVSPSAGIVLLFITIILGSNIAFNYYMTIFTPPGCAPDQTPEEVKLAEQQATREPDARRGEGFSRFCKFCKKSKPPRSHHCHICKSCVLRMDHHCPWVNNCVGFYNHKYFVLFLLYLWTGCGFVALISLLPFRSTRQFYTSVEAFRVGILFSFVLAISIFFALSILLGWHIYLVLTGQTTIEFYYNRTRARQSRLNGELYQNEYDLGSAKNWSIFFGQNSYPFAWLLPSTRRVPGDGIVFLTRSEHLRKTGVNHHFV